MGSVYLKKERREEMSRKILLLVVLICMFSFLVAYPMEIEKRSPQEDTEEDTEPPIWCSFSNPWRSRVRVDEKCKELAGV